MKKKRMTVTEKYMSMKRQAEQAGMSVTEKNGKLVVARVKPSAKKSKTKSKVK